MKTFPHPEVTKAVMVADMIAHREADEFIRGSYGKRHGVHFRGCAVGCSIHTINRMRGTNYGYGNHGALAKETGAPEWLLYLVDKIFERLSAPDYKDWPVRFWQIVPEGVDLSVALAPILTRILREVVLPEITVDEWGVKDAIAEVCVAIESGYKSRMRAAAVAADAAYAADAAVAYAAAVAADAAYAAATDAAAHAAEGAAYNTSEDAWRLIADIVCEEVARCGEGDDQ